MGQKVNGGPRPGETKEEWLARLRALATEVLGEDPAEQARRKAPRRRKVTEWCIRHRCPAVEWRFEPGRGLVAKARCKPRVRCPREEAERRSEQNKD